MADSILLRAKAAALVAIAEHGISPDVQELLLSGDGRGQAAPGALDKALRAAFMQLREPTASMRSAGLQACSNPSDEAPERTAMCAERYYPPPMIELIVTRYRILGGDPDRLQVTQGREVLLDVRMGIGSPLHPESAEAARSRPYFYTGSPHGADILALARERGVIE